MAKNVEFDILARDRASKTFDHVGKSAGGLSSKLGMLGKGAIAGVGIAAGVAAVGGIAALGSAMIQGVKDAASYQQLANKTAAVLKSTGNAANQSVLGIQRRAGALETLSGVDEEIIINGQNVLATFTKVRDSVGKGNDIFNQATTAALNMSTALGTDMQSSVIQLGKALNDPIKGITALSRVGVSFTADQKKQIKTLVESGQTMKAQKVILAELNKEFGGAAKAAGEGFNGAWARAKDSIQDAFRAIGVKLLPALTQLGNYVAEHGGPFIEDFTRKLGAIWARVQPGLAALGGWFMNTGLPAIQGFAGWIKNDLWPALQEGYQRIMPGLKQALSIVSGAFQSGGSNGKGFGETLKTVAKVITEKVIPFVGDLARVYLPILATNIRAGIEAVKAMWKAFEVWRSVARVVITFIMRSISAMASAFAAALEALSHIPGFGWAKDAAARLRTLADQANAVADSINRIPRTVTVNTYFKTHGSPNPLSGKGSGAGVKGYAVGGVNIPRGWKVVGEQGPELMWTPGGDTVIPADQTRQMLSGKRTVRGSAGGDVYNNTFVLPHGTTDQQAEALWQAFLGLKRRRGVNLGLA